MASLYNSIPSLLKGGSESSLTDRIGAVFWRYLKDNELIIPTNGIANQVVIHGCTLDVEEEGDSIIAEGIVDGLFQRIKLETHQYKCYRLVLQKFLFHVLGLSSLMDESQLGRKKMSLLAGTTAQKVINLTAYGCTVYWCPINSDSEFSAVEQDNDGRLSNEIVIITPRGAVPKSFQSKIGNCQHIELKQLIDESDGEIDINPLSNLIKGAKQKQGVYPYYIHPQLKPDCMEWENFKLEIGRVNIILSYKNKNATESYRHSDLYFSRSPKAESQALSIPMTLLLLLGAGYKWKSLKKPKHRKLLERTNRELQTFFRQSERFYEKDENGLYHPRLAITVEHAYLSELQESWAQSVENDIDASESSGLRHAMLETNLAKRKSTHEAFDEN